MLSVIIPVYNVERYLSRCIQSVVEQTYIDLEIILVDDGSTDGSAALCDELAEKDARIKAVHKENGGLSSARNAGLGICKGDYVFFIDSDDWLADKNVLSDFIHTAEQEDSDFVYGLMNTATDEKQVPIKAGKRIADDRLFFLSNPYLFSACNKVYARTLLQHLHFVPGRINEDVDVIPLVFCHAKKVSRLDRATYNYYSNPNSITRSQFSEKRFDMFKSVKHVHEKFTGTKEEKAAFYRNIFGFQIFSVYIEILKRTNGTERKKYLLRFCDLLKENEFDCFFHHAALCFLCDERFEKKLKKFAALSYLKIFYLANSRSGK